MAHNKRTLTLDDVRSATHFASQHLEDWIARAALAYSDLDRATRTERHECRWCYYGLSTRMGGAAMTTKACGSCGTAMTFPSTNTDRVCKPCGQELGICVHCGADIHLRDRRKLGRRPRAKRSEAR